MENDKWLPALRQLISIEDRLIAIDTDFDHFVDQFLAAGQLLQNEREQFPLPLWKNLRQNDDEACMELLPGIELPEVASIVSHEREIIGDDAWHQIPIGLSAQAQPVYMRAIVTIALRDGHKRGVKAFVDQKFHEDEPVCFAAPAFLSDTRFDNLIVIPSSESFRGRPLAGCAAVQISESSTMRAVREG